MTAAASSATSDLSRKRRLRRFLWWAVGVLVFFLLLALAVQRLLIRQMRLPRLVITQNGNVMSVAVAPDGQTIFTGNDPTYDALRTHGNRPADVFVWDAANGRLIRSLPGFYWRSSGISASPDGKHVIAGGEAHKDAFVTIPFRVICWDWQSGQKQWEINGDTPLSYSTDGRLVGNANGVYNASTGKLICSTSKNIDDDGQSAFTPDGKLFGIVGGLNINYRTMPNRAAPDTDNGKSLYSTTRLQFWRTDTGKEAKDFPFTRVRAFDIAHNGLWLILTSDTDGMVGGSDGSIVRRLDIKTGAVLWKRERHMNGPNPDLDAVFYSAVISPNGKYVVLASINSRLVVLDAQTGRELFRPFFPKSGDVGWALPGGLAFSAGGKTLVSRCGRKTLVWDTSILQ